MTDASIYLASNSPRRRELLDQIGVRYQLLKVDVDETARPGEPVDALVQRLALDKARAGWMQLSESQLSGSQLSGSQRRPVLGADTLVLCQGEVLGKPRDRADALAILARLSGRTQDVLSAVALVGAFGERVALNRSQVRFRSISAVEAEAYWNTGEPADKAGAYAVQGLGAVFIEELRGSYSGVMGLPLFETARLLEAAGIAVLREKRGSETN